jgi:hypothetical protein
MREFFNNQKGLEFQPFDPKSGADLEIMDEILKENQGILNLVEKDIAGGADKSKGRPGMSAEQVLRIAIVKKLYEWSYRLLRERVEDSMLLRGLGYPGRHDGGRDQHSPSDGQQPALGLGSGNHSHLEQCSDRSPRGRRHLARPDPGREEEDESRLQRKE